jgi:hypothetical protein
MPRGSKIKANLHTILVDPEEWERARTVAVALGCLSPAGEPSVGRLVREIGAGRIHARRVQAQPLTLAARIRAMAEASPEMSNKAISLALGCGLDRVINERRRAAERLRRSIEAPPT